jgi:L-ribulose-5-phosphate 3-epimerase
MLDRRQFLALSALGVLGACERTVTNSLPSVTGGAASKPLYRISLAEWSVNRRIRNAEKPALAHLDFPAYAKKLGIDAVEYVSTLFKDGSTDAKYIQELAKRCDGEGVESLLIMVDGEGFLGDADPEKRKKAVANHHRWVDTAQALGCHSIRVNARSSGSYDEQMKRAAEGLSALGDYGAKQGIDVIVENHGGYSSNGAWLAGVMKLADHPRVGTLPDFGNFNLGDGKSYDRYQGVTELMPYAKAVSAKSHDFDDEGNEKHTDYLKMMRIVVDAGYRGYVGIEFEGRGSSEKGILATKALLERVRGQLERERDASKKTPSAAERR